MVSSKDSRRALRGAAVAATLLVGCSDSLEISVALVDPCNQEAVATVDYIGLEPRGTGIDSTALSTIEEVGAFSAPEIAVPLAPDFQLVATGHRGAFDAAATALGISAPVDLTEAEGAVSIQVPFSLLGQFYRTTNLSLPETDANRCSQLGTDRFGATATVLPSGHVVVVGGVRYVDGFIEYPRTVEVYDPSTGTFLSGPPGSSGRWELSNGQARRSHTATLLSNGQILITGGQAPSADVVGAEGALQTAFFIDASDPTGLQISAGGVPLNGPRTGHQAVALSDGRVVLVGGIRALDTSNRLEQHTYLDSVEVYDPSLGAFLVASDASANAIRLSAARSGHSAVAVPGANAVFVAGGYNGSGPVTSVDVVRFSVGGAQVTTAGASLTVGPIHHAAGVTQEGAIVLSGGYSTLANIRSAPAVDSVANVEMWAVDPETGTAISVCTDAMLAARGQHTMSVIGQRAVIVGGRDTLGAPRADAEVGRLNLVADAGSSCFALTPEMQSMSDARAEHAAAVLSGTQEVLVLGGVQADATGQSTLGSSIRSAEIYSDLSRRQIVTR